MKKEEDEEVHDNVGERRKVERRFYLVSPLEFHDTASIAGLRVACFSAAPSVRSSKSRNSVDDTSISWTNLPTRVTK
jgi:hypothetical protein